MKIVLIVIALFCSTTVLSQNFNNQLFSYKKTKTGLSITDVEQNNVLFSVRGNKIVIKEQFISEYQLDIVRRERKGYEWKLYTHENLCILTIDQRGHLLEVEIKYAALNISIIYSR